MATLGASALVIALPLITLWPVWLYQPFADLVTAALATMLFLLLHVHHVVYALRGEWAPHAIWSLLAMTAVIVATAFVLGMSWVVMLSSVALSTLVIVRWQRDVGNGDRVHGVVVGETVYELVAAVGSRRNTGNSLIASRRSSGSSLDGSTPRAVFMRLASLGSLTYVAMKSVLERSCNS